MKDMKEIRLTIDGKTVSAPEGSTILEAARAAGIDIPTLCAYEGLKPKAACRLCQVQVEGEEKEKLACATKVKPGMRVTTDSPELFARRKALIQEMFRQHTVDCHHCLRIGSTKAEHFDPKFCESCFFCDCVRDGFCELQSLALRFGVDQLPFEIREHDFGVDCSTGSVIRNMDKCVKCRRCTEICEGQGVGILGLRRRDGGQTVGAKNNMLTDGCIRCGRCVEVCPTGALFMAEHKDEIVYFAHQYGTQTVALLCPDAVEPLEKLYGERFSFEQVAAALRKIGIDHVLDGRGAQARSRARAARLLDERLGHGPLLLTGNYAAKQFLESRLPELREHFAFYDSTLKCFSDYARERFHGAKLLVISADNSCGAEALETGAADYFVNPRELYRIFLRTGGAPAKRIPLPAEALPAGEPAGRYEALLQDETWGIKAAPGEYTVEKDGKLYRALICRNPLQVKKEQGQLNSYDVIRVLA